MAGYLIIAAIIVGSLLLWWFVGRGEAPTHRESGGLENQTPGMFGGGPSGPPG